jgi:hypothetical protein
MSVIIWQDVRSMQMAVRSSAWHLLKVNRFDKFVKLFYNLLDCADFRALAPLPEQERPTRWSAFWHLPEQ